MVEPFLCVLIGLDMTCICRPNSQGLNAKGELDLAIVPCPMSLRCTAWIDQIVLFQDNAFLRTSAHEIVPIAGYLPATCWIVVVCRDLKRVRTL